MSVLKNLHLLFFVVAACLSLPAVAQDDALQKYDFKPLFNGKDLTGWKPVNTAPSTWKVSDDGMLLCSGKPIGELRTERMYQNFVMEVEWRHMKPKGNAGIFVWADDITAKGKPFHRGIEVQVLENAYGNTSGYTTHGDIFPIHGATMTPENGRGGSRAFPTEKRSKPATKWNHYRITCKNRAISLAVNGKVVTRGKDCSPAKGYICLESEGGVVQYRNLKIHELPDTPLDKKHIAIADRGFRSLYSGVDLAGWQTESNHWQPNDWVLHYGGAGAQDDALISEETFAGGGFVFDIRRKEKRVNHIVNIMGTDIKIGPADQEIFATLANGRGWNRFEGAVRSGKLTLTVNGKSLRPRTLGSSAKVKNPITIRPGSPVDFANIFVRP